MNQWVGIVVVLALYMGAWTLGVKLFGEGPFAIIFTVVIGGIGTAYLMDSSNKEK